MRVPRLALRGSLGPVPRHPVAPRRVRCTWTASTRRPSPATRPTASSGSSCPRVQAEPRAARPPWPTRSPAASAPVLRALRAHPPHRRPPLERRRRASSASRTGPRPLAQQCGGRRKRGSIDERGEALRADSRRLPARARTPFRGARPTGSCAFRVRSPATACRPPSTSSCPRRDEAAKRRRPVLEPHHRHPDHSRQVPDRRAGGLVPFLWATPLSCSWSAGSSARSSCARISAPWSSRPKGSSTTRASCSSTTPTVRPSGNFALKQARLEAQRTGEALRHPLPGPVTLRWRELAASSCLTSPGTSTSRPPRRTSGCLPRGGG